MRLAAVVFVAALAFALAAARGELRLGSSTPAPPAVVLGGAAGSDLDLNIEGSDRSLPRGDGPVSVAVSYGVRRLGTQKQVAPGEAGKHALSSDGNFTICRASHRCARLVGIEDVSAASVRRPPEAPKHV